jgi:hypothetical protein
MPLSRRSSKEAGLSFDWLFMLICHEGFAPVRTLNGVAHAREHVYVATTFLLNLSWFHVLPKYRYVLTLKERNK